MSSSQVKALHSSHLIIRQHIPLLSYSDGKKSSVTTDHTNKMEKRTKLHRMVSCHLVLFPFFFKSFSLNPKREKKS